jgi:undecaprenyl diphosphate synthase
MALMTLLKNFLLSEKQELMENNIRLHTIGQTQRLPEPVRDALTEAMAATCHNDAMVLNLALSYGARTEIVDMVKAIASKAQQGLLDPRAITEEVVSQHLYTGKMADPDLLIRTSGEMRISNFLLWQIAYAEIHVTDTLWPDFGREEFIRILMDYQSRERRFGKVHA